MSKRIVLTTVVLLLVCAVSPQASSSKQPHVSGHSIGIDPGHGGADLGSTACSGLLEKDANLQIALRLEELLLESGARVHLTRREDVDLSSHERAAILNETDAEVLVNLHLNGWEDSSFDGLYVLFAKSRKDRAFAQAMHDAMWEELKDTPTDFYDYGIRQLAAGVMLWTDVPSALLESVFISNDYECAWLTNGTGNRQDDIARAIYVALNDWFRRDPPTEPGNGP